MSFKSDEQRRLALESMDYRTYTYTLRTRTSVIESSVTARDVREAREIVAMERNMTYHDVKRFGVFRLVPLNVERSYRSKFDNMA